MMYCGIGEVIMNVLLGVATIVFFIASCAYRCFGLRKEKRPPVVFFFDLLKMLAAGLVSSVVNCAFTAKVSWAANGITVRGKPLEGIGWYGAISDVDVLVSAPLSIDVSRLVNRTCNVVDRRMRAASPWNDTVQQNIVCGKDSDSMTARATTATARRRRGGRGGTRR